MVWTTSKICKTQDWGGNGRKEAEEGFYLLQHQNGLVKSKQNALLPRALAGVKLISFDAIFQLLS